MIKYVMIQIMKYVVLVILGAIIGISIMLNMTAADDMVLSGEMYESHRAVLNESGYVAKTFLTVLFFMFALFVFLDHRVYQAIAERD